MTREQRMQAKTLELFERLREALHRVHEDYRRSGIEMPKEVRRTLSAADAHATRRALAVSAEPVPTGRKTIVVVLKARTQIVNSICLKCHQPWRADGKEFVALVPAGPRGNRTHGHVHARCANEGRKVWRCVACSGLVMADRRPHLACPHRGTASRDSRKCGARLWEELNVLRSADSATESKP